MMTSLVLGGGRYPPELVPFAISICLSRSAASSGVARGRTPGSLKLVRSRVPITKKNRMPPTTGMAGVIFTARYGQSKAKKSPLVTRMRMRVR